MTLLLKIFQYFNSIIRAYLNLYKSSDLQTRDGKQYGLQETFLVVASQSCEKVWAMVVILRKKRMNH